MSSYRISEYTDEEWINHKDRSINELGDYEVTRQQLEDELNQPDLINEIMDDVKKRSDIISLESYEDSRKEMIKIQNARWWKPWTWKVYFHTSV